MSNVDPQQTPGNPSPPPAPTPPQQTSKTVPQWLRTSIVAAMAVAFLIHVGYDAITEGYDEFNTSFLILGFIGVALGYDIIGRNGS